ncbi:MAG: hypothetical protein FWE02_05605 [Defluviitaleaceae bacterium]|nr:hypothetical protein [Defluviitaleaceae bacterium]
MLATEYLLSIENTPDEAKLFENLSKTFEHEEEAVAQALEKTKGIPVAGNKVGAIMALHEMGSITHFKETDHFANLEGWSLYVNLDTGMFNLYPGPKMRKQIFICLGVIATAIFLLVKFLRRNKHNLKY